MYTGKSLKSYTAVLVLLLLGAIYNDRTVLKHAFRSKKVSYASIQSSPRILYALLQVLKKNNIDPRAYTVVDVGCGDAVFLKELSKYFQHCVGIEIDKSTAEVAQKNTASCSNVEIHHQDMVDYVFVDRPTIVFMYEPLWMVPQEKAWEIYTQLFQNMFQTLSPDNVRIAYVNGVYRKRMKQPFLESIGVEILERHAVGSFLLRKEMKFMRRKRT